MIKILLILVLVNLFPCYKKHLVTGSKFLHQRIGILSVNSAIKKFDVKSLTAVPKSYIATISSNKNRPSLTVLIYISFV